jgi:putative MATE family efflux protein
MFRDRDRLDLTSGGIAKPLFYLSLPIVVTNLLHTAYNLADTFWLGQYSTTALAAISFAFPMVFLLISFGLGISVAGSVLVAQNVGGGDERRAEFAASQTVTFALVVAAAIGAVGFFVVDDLLRIFGASPDVLVAATRYMRIVSLGLPFMFGFFVFISLMRGYGDTVTPMLVMFGTVALNVALDPFLIYGWWLFPELGVEGAAYATVFARGLSMFVGFGIMLSGTRGVRIRPREMVPDPAFALKVLRIGGPASVEGGGRATSVNLLLIVVGMFATPVVAGFGIGIRVFSLIFLPAIAVARGVETMAGQNIGAGKEDRAQATADFAARAMFVVLATVGVVIFLFPRPIVAVFTNDAAVISTGVEFLRYVSPTFGFVGFMRAYTGAFKGAGKTLVAAIIAISFMGFVRLPIAWFLSLKLGPVGIWWGFVVSNVAGAAIAWTWYSRGTWREADITGGTGPGPGPGPGPGDDLEATSDD